jgi:hypothetical protein
MAKSPFEADIRHNFNLCHIPSANWITLPVMPKYIFKLAEGRMVTAVGTIIKEILQPHVVQKLRSKSTKPRGTVMLRSIEYDPGVDYRGNRCLCNTSGSMEGNSLI